MSFNDPKLVLSVSTHSRPKAAGQFKLKCSRYYWFQLTAARRRLGMDLMVIGYAGTGFNSQPPEGGWVFIIA